MTRFIIVYYRFPVEFVKFYKIDAVHAVNKIIVERFFFVILLTPIGRSGDDHG